MNVPFEIGSGRGHPCICQAIRDAKTAKGLRVGRSERLLR